MKRADKAVRIMNMLQEFYPETPVPLDHEDPYTLLVAVLLSAQCTDKRVNLTTPGLFARAKTPETMREVPVDEIRELIRPCGLSPTKAKNIQALSHILVEKHGGIVPASFEELEALPGVGHKTAGVVMAQSFGIPAFPVDTHIHRLAARWGLSKARNVEETERDLKKTFPKRAMECASPSDHFLREGVLPSSGAYPRGMPYLQLGCNEEKKGHGSQEKEVERCSHSVLIETIPWPFLVTEAVNS